MAVGIEAVVELADSEQMAVLPRELVRCRFPLSDGGPNHPWLLRLAADSVAALLRARVPTLVCCPAGMSRSVCVADSGVALADGRSLEEALALVVASGPVDVSPALLGQVRDVLASPSEVYVALMNEGTAVWRPVPAEQVGPGVFRLGAQVPEGESWEFGPGEVVRCEWRLFSGGETRLVAVERAEG
jgi:hypothetical protein